MQAPSGNEVDDVIRDLKKISGFTAYVILNNDGMGSAVRLDCNCATSAELVVCYLRQELSSSTRICPTKSPYITRT
jgi:hypothetical protein